MKIIAIGDTHGRTDWKKISGHKCDKFVFIGDYFDTHEGISPIKQIDNFKDILEYKKANMEKVVLLFGNHDFHYLSEMGEHYSGYQPEVAIDIEEAIKTALKEDLLQMCYVHKNIAFTHAGITKTWCKDNAIDLENLEQSINDVFKYHPAAFKFRGIDMSGDDITQSPIWVRPKSLGRDLIDKVHVVGHTTMHSLQIIEDRLIFIDTLPSTGEYLIIENDFFKKGKKMKPQP